VNRVVGGQWAIDRFDEVYPNIDSYEVDYEVFYPKINVYKNLLPKSNQLVDVLKESLKDRSSSYYFNMWDKWHVFGDTISRPVFNPIYPDIVDQDKLDAELELDYMLQNAFAIATAHYIKSYGIKKGQDWTTMGPSICRYEPDNPIFDEPGMVNTYSMKYHSDYDFMRAEEPGDKFAITCTMYLNDDYEGGDLIFDFKNDSVKPFGEDTNPSSDNTKTYKPKAGEIIVFPSGHPEILSEENVYFHGVGYVEKQSKFFIRSYFLIPYEGSAQWLANEKKYGAEAWGKMELERMKSGARTHEELMLRKTQTENSGKECGTF